MHIYELGWVFIPVTLLLFFGWRRALVPWCAILAVFQAGVVFNLELGGRSLPLQPGYFAAIFVLVALLPSTLRSKDAILSNKSFVRMLAPLMLVLLYGLASSYICPRVFAGVVDVYRPGDGMQLDSVFVLSPSGSNITQPAYLLLVVGVACVIAWAVAQDGSLAVETVFRGFAIAGCVVVAIGMYQFVAFHTGLPFPNWLWSEEDVVERASSMTISGAKRVNSTFTESSRLGCYLAGFIPFAVWVLIRGRKRFLPLAIGAEIILLLSTSSLGYVSGAVMAIFLMIKAMFSGSRQLLRGLLIHLFVLLLLALLVLLTIGLLSPNTNWIDYLRLNEVLERQVLQKTESGSFENRSTADLTGLAVLPKTYGFGVGWGSHRSSSMISHLLANLGIWGCIPVVWFVVAVAKEVRRAFRFGTLSPQERLAMEGCVWMVVGISLAGSIASPGVPIMMILWIPLAILMGVSASANHRGDKRLRKPRNGGNAGSGIGKSL